MQTDEAFRLPGTLVGCRRPTDRVLATKNAMIPNVGGVQIGCRMMMTVLKIPLTALHQTQCRLKRGLEAATRFHVDASMKER